MRAALCAALLVVGCSLPAGDVRFTAADGRQSALRISNVDGHRYHHLAPAEGITATGILQLRKPVAVATGQVFSLQYQTTVAEATISILSNRDHEAARYHLVTRGDVPIRRYLLLPAGTLWGFRLWTEDLDGQLDLIAAEVEPIQNGFELVDGVLHIGVDTHFSRGTQVDAAGLTTLAANLTTADITPQTGRGLSLRLSFTPDSAGDTGELLLSISGENNTGSREVIVKVTLTGSERLVHLHETVLGFVPTGVQALSNTGGSVRFVELRRTVFDTGPLPADLQAILIYPQAAWRGPDWEVFRWTAFDEVLIFDTASYRIQEMLFRRLAYFVEKARFRGRILTDDELAGRYGYNAHDYTAADLARFFTQAANDRVQLNDQELWLRDFLVAEGVIRTGSDAWEAGSGAVLSISRESSPALREQLLQHEAAHGLYFVEPAYRLQISKLWQNIDESARAAWRAYLSSLAYDTSWEDLVINEFQAYLAQHREANIGYYFGVLVPSRLDRNRSVEQEAAVWFETGSKALLNQHQEINRALRAVAGIRAGSLSTVSLTHLDRNMPRSQH